mgnify:CR=1 FL=1
MAPEDLAGWQVLHATFESAHPWRQLDGFAIHINRGLLQLERGRKEGAAFLVVHRVLRDLVYRGLDGAVARERKGFELDGRVLACTVAISAWRRWCSAARRAAPEICTAWVARVGVPGGAGGRPPRLQSDH